MHIQALRQVASTNLPTRWGEFRLLGFERDVDEAGWLRRETAIALVMGDVSGDAPLLRIHSQCLTGDVFGSLRCDCGKQLELAMSAIAGEQRGIVIYEQQEGRGIGLISKLLAYERQDCGADTVDANEILGLESDYRDFSFAVQILRTLRIPSVRLLSNNPEKISALLSGGITVAQLSCEPVITPYALPYLRTKKEKLGHLLSRDRLLSSPANIPHPRREVRTLRLCPPATRINEAFTDVDTAIAELRAGRMVIVIDDQERENEGDLVMAAAKITPAAVNFMAQYGRGLICLSLAPERVEYLRLAPMCSQNTSLFATPFTESIDAIGRGVTTGTSAYDRAQTIRAVLDPATRPSDLARPGHVFPLVARKGGVLERPGHTEASVDLARMSGMAPAGVICEIMNPDGSMARVPQLIDFSKQHGLKLLSIADLIRYRSFQKEPNSDRGINAADLLVMPPHVKPRRQSRKLVARRAAQG